MGIKEAIKSQFKSSKQKALVNIIYTANWLRDLQQDVFKHYDILAQHYNVLRIVNGKKKEPLSPSEIKEVMLDKGRDLTRLVDKLVALGLVERKLSDANRRKMEISITPKGIEVVEKIQQDLDVLLLKTFKLKDDEAENLSDLLDKLRE